MVVDKYYTLVEKMKTLVETLMEDYNRCFENVTHEDLMVALEIVKLNSAWSNIALLLAKHDVPDDIYTVAIRMLDDEITNHRVSFKAPEALMRLIECEVEVNGQKV